MTPTKIILTTLAAALAVSIAPATVRAQKRVVVLSVEGARNKSLQDDLSEIIRKENRVISSRTYTRTARRLKARKLSPEDVARVSAKISADGVLQSMIVADDDGYVLRLRLHEGASGRTVKKLAVRLSRPSLPGRLRKALAKHLLPAIDHLQFNDSGDDDDMDSDARDNARTAVGDGDDDLNDRPRKRARRSRRTARREERRSSRARDRKRSRKDEIRDEPVDDEDAIRDDDRDRDEDRDVRTASRDEDVGVDDDMGDRDAPGPADNRTAAERRRSGVMILSAGASVVDRSLRFTYRSDLTDAPKGYKGPAAPAARVSGELYPLAKDGKKKGLGPNLGIGFEAEYVFGLQTAILDGGGMMANLATTESRYGASAILRHNFGDKGPSIQVSVGYGRLQFKVDKPTDVVVDLPNTSYTYFDPGLAARYPVTPKISLFAGARALLITGAGEVQQRDQYGTAKLTGVDADGGVEYLFAKRYMLTVAARFTAVGYQFQGDGDMTVMRDGDPNTVDVGGALDKYLSGSATLGYLF